MIPSSNLGRPTIFLTLADDVNDTTYNLEKKHTYNSALSFNLTKEFFEYIEMKDYTRNHVIHLRSYYNRRLKGKKFDSAILLEKYLNTIQKGLNHSIKTARVYLNFLEKYEKAPIELIEKYRKVLKLKSSKPDVYVPSDDEVLKNLELIKSSKELEIVYLVLMTSGIRIIECLDLLKNYDKSKFRVNDKYASYNVGSLRHTKNINNIYVPKFVYDKLFKMNVGYNALSERIARKKLSISLKYLRKWQYNFLLFNGVPESVADFIQGRASKSVASNHYMAKTQQADFWYEKVVEKIIIY